MSLGPFDVTAAQIESLGTRFTEFINRLLDAEVAAHGLSGSRLAVTLKETTPDGGVDAAIRGATATDWLPADDSAWQSKRSNLGPKPCAAEFERATWAHEFVRNGGSYVVVLGAPLPDRLVEDRRKKIVEEAIELGLLSSGPRALFSPGSTAPRSSRATTRTTFLEIPKGYSWDDVRGTDEPLMGKALNDALAAIGRANPKQLAGVFERTDFNNKMALPSEDLAAT